MKNSLAFDDLSIFLTVLDEGGFRAAARRLDLAPSKVSTTVSGIEAQLGAPLLQRSTRSIRATEQGQALAERIRPLLAEIAAACRDTAQAAGRIEGRLKLNVPGAVMPDILPALICGFQARHPAVEVEILVENDLVDIVASGCDAGIRYGAVLEKDMISIPIGPRRQQIAFAAAPDYLARCGMPQTPEALADHEAIRYRLPGGPILPWRCEHLGETVTVAPVNRLILSVNALDTGLNFARQGLGIIGMFRNWLEGDFGRGSLLPVLPDWWSEQDGPRLYYPNRFAPAPLRAFIAFCSENGPS